MHKGQIAIEDHFKNNDWSYWSPHEMLARLTEEVGELARLINHEYGAKTKKDGERMQEFSEEIGDILYTLACLANTHNINLDESLQQSIIKSHTRDTDRFNLK